MLIFDGHLDLAMNALLHERDQTLSVAALRQREAAGVDDTRGVATVSLPELREAGAAVVVATLIARVKSNLDPARPLRRDTLDYPDASMAYAVAQGQLAYYRLLEARGEIRIITDAPSLDAHLADWQHVDTARKPVGVILLMEGADPIVEPGQIHAWATEGLRVLGLAHYGKGRYAAGTPSMDPDSLEQDGPLSPMAYELLEQMAKLPMALDLTHLGDTSFMQASEAFDGPMCASHSNCRTLADTVRQLTDEQIKQITHRGGVIGMAMHKGMIHWPGDNPPRAAVALSQVVEHVDHICQLAGSAAHVGLGTDLDGGFGSEACPHDLNDYRDLHKLGSLLAGRGFSDADIAGFFHGNWLRFYRQVLSRSIGSS